MNTDLETLRRKRAALSVRAAVLRALRAFFDAEGFLEVETPVRLRAPALEPHIDAEPSGAMFLRTSPELHMKRLLAAGFERIYQIGPCFRRGERGARHHPEYTMLEWYRARADYQDILRDAERLVRAAGAAAAEAGARAPEWVGAPWRVITVSEAFRRWAGWDPVEHWDADRFDLDLVERVEPALARAGAAVLCDYPAPAAALARLKPGNPRVAERWELYLGGLEVANAYSELTDAAEQRARFEQAARDRAARGKPVYPIDEDFLAALAAGLPPCGGAALGVDRLAMALTGASAIAEVAAFLESEPPRADA